MKIEKVCHSCGDGNPQWRIKEGNLYIREYHYYCDKCKEEMTMPGQPCISNANVVYF